MSKKIYLKSLNQLISLDKPIIEIIFDDPKLYRLFLYNIENQVIYSIDNQTLDFSKSLLRIYNPFDLEINSRKTILQVYKNIQKSLNDELKKDISSMEMEIFELLDKLLEDEELALSYTAEINFIDLLSICKVEFKNIEHNNYLEKLVYYLKINNKYNNSTIVISSGLLNILTDEEIELLKKELQLLQMNMIDISINTKAKKVQKLFIDNEWCVI